MSEPTRIEGLLAQYEELRDQGTPPSPEELCRDCPELLDDFKHQLRVLASADGMLFGTGGEESGGIGRPPAPGRPPQLLGRYRILARLGSGSFGGVYKAFDEVLRREVAIKIPHRHRVARPEDVEPYLTEARFLARLDHPHVVPVHDAGQTDDGLCYVVSKFIEGHDLATTIKAVRLGGTESAALVAAVAEALDYAHRHGLVHRDIKPANILIDTSGKPYVADFGLALTEEDLGKGAAFAGTPAYMSPEQARGEGHRVDGRSDLFSLGVVFYELLTGRRPFQGETRRELLEQIITAEPPPPRQIDDRIPKELERICLKALSKRASERYPTARDMADDLRHYLDQAAETAPFGRPLEGPATEGATPVSPRKPASVAPIKVVPKGLRSFDAHDAGFFLELLPGPRDREGLPESLRFWKSRIEGTTADPTFTVGLIYGPSGCGKSSLMKAGLLPRLASHVLPVYIEATADETESRLLKSLRKPCPEVPVDLSLADTLAALRRGRTPPAGQKVLLILDQFEQWLHAHRPEANTALIQALRQCDGELVQCVLLVRDDFWMAVTRFMQALEIELVPGRNIAAVDLFDRRHARKVLAAFGRALGALPERVQEQTRDQETFLDQAVVGLAQEGKVISVRLALFAEMVKGKPWTPATLKGVGGPEGVGVTFLEEIFSAVTAPPAHRLHQAAARAVLKALLPETGTDIKGQMRSHQDLLAVSGYANRPQAFRELLRLLDGELRLVTPTDRDEVERRGDQRLRLSAAEQALASAAAGGYGKFYQLTHDYLVPSLRAWLTRKQTETRRGRAELRLAERAAAWHAKPENRQLPAWWEWANIRLLTRKMDWTSSQQQMMQKAGRYHALRVGVLLVFLALGGWSANEAWGNHRASTLIATLKSSETREIRRIIDELSPYRRWIDPKLHALFEQDPPTPKEKLHAALALVATDSRMVGWLKDELLTAELETVLVIRDILEGHRVDLSPGLWRSLSSEGDSNRRFRAALALAAYDPPASANAIERWQNQAPFLAEQLIATLIRNPSHYKTLVDALRPVRSLLLRPPAPGPLRSPLGMIFQDATRSEAERLLAATILAEYTEDQPDIRILADYILDAEPRQYALLWPKLKAHEHKAVELMNDALGQPIPSAAEARDQLARRQAQAAVVLAQLGKSQGVWPLLRHSDDPTRRTYLLHALGRLGTDPGLLFDQLRKEGDPSVRRALILSLGEFTTEQLGEQRKAMVELLVAWYRTDPDPGIHSAIDWLFRHDQLGKTAWKLDRQETEQLKQIDADLLGRPPGGRDWYLTTQGHTMTVVRQPEEFLKGDKGPRQVRTKIGRSFAIATKEVTKAQFRAFARETELVAEAASTVGLMGSLPGQGPLLAGAALFPGRIRRWTQSLEQDAFSREDQGPMLRASWYEAVRYCNWLSQKEGLPESQWCYEPNSVGLFAEGMKLKRNYLTLTGYRLPTEAEWEYACRAGSTTDRFFGSGTGMLKEYAWYGETSHGHAWPVGLLKPNDLGLFDVYGNALEWCQDRLIENLAPEEERRELERRGKDGEDPKLEILDQDFRVLRGGSFSFLAPFVRSADASFNEKPTHIVYNIGIRVARTLGASVKGALARNARSGG